ncbi:hypothetical protein BH18ACT15_BH18ACT15_11920 [soil metagenome]
MQTVEETESNRTQFLTVRLSKSVHRALVELAQEHERSLAGEVRHLLRRYTDDPDSFVGVL